MTEHDPLCSQPGLPTGVCFECADIRKLRSDERERAVQRIKALPWTSDSWLAHAERAAIIAAIEGDQP